MERHKRAWPGKHKQKQRTTNIFKFSLRPPTKLHTELFEIRHTSSYFKIAALFFGFRVTLDKGFIGFGSAWEAKILASD